MSGPMDQQNAGGPPGMAGGPPPMGQYGAGGPPPMGHYNAGGPPGMYNAPPAGRPPRPGWFLPVMIVGGLIVLACVGCLGLAAIGALTGDDATPTPAAASVPSSSPATQATTRTPTTRAASASSRPSASSAAGASASAAPVVVAGCGGASISNPTSQIRTDISQWNRIVDSANEITDAWNAFNRASGSRGFDSAKGDQQLVALADTFLATANEHLPALRKETASGRFAAMATAEIAAVEAQIAFVTPYRQAVANSDAAAWDQAIDASDALDTTNAALDAEVERQCAYWRSVD